MRVEHITLGIEGAELEGEVIDSLAEAQKAGDTYKGASPGYSSDI